MMSTMSAGQWVLLGTGFWMAVGLAAAVILGRMSRQGQGWPTAEERDEAIDAELHDLIDEYRLRHG